MKMIIIIIETRKRKGRRGRIIDERARDRGRRNKPTKCLAPKKGGVIFLRNETKIWNQNPRFVTFLSLTEFSFFGTESLFGAVTLQVQEKGCIMSHDVLTKLDNKALLLLPP